MFYSTRKFFTSEVFQWITVIVGLPSNSEKMKKSTGCHTISNIFNYSLNVNYEFIDQYQISITGGFQICIYIYDTYFKLMTNIYSQ